MKKRIKVSALKPGMRVILPSSWLSHPFLKNQFTISSEDQIKTIINSGFKEVTVEITDSVQSISDGVGMPDEPGEPLTVWDPEEIVPDELRSAIKSKSLDSQKKASIVYKSSLTIMKRILEDPKAANIVAAKEGITEIVDFIISDDSTTKNLLTITSYDYYTYTHSVNVGVLSILLSKLLFQNSDAHDLHELGSGFFLHDIGKVHVDPAILNKPGRLTEDEMKQMRTHPFRGYKLLHETAQLTEECRIIVMQHHERNDGTGYPKKLRGEEIHLYGRICCIADVYDALTAERSYKKKLEPFEALQLMKEQMLSHFHRDLFDRFVHLFC
jgi:HD-GYP domain-containing protein (c-di-GMP phosphodiesterase class II)